MNRKPRLQIFVTGVIWSLLSAASFWYSHPRRGWILAGMAGLFILSALLVPPLARALHHALSFLVQALVTTVTWTLLSLTYFLLMAPLGLVLRWTGSLRTARGSHSDPALATYWVDRTPEPLVPSRYLRPF